jgi:hypothetical protein
MHPHITPRAGPSQEPGDFDDRSRQALLPGFAPPPPESECALCGGRGRAVGRRQSTVIFACTDCEQVWELFDPSGPPCPRCGCATTSEPGRGPHFRAARCPVCRHHWWLKKPRENSRETA